MKDNDQKVLFSSNSDEWGTPKYLYDELDKEFHFTLDACATEFNYKCSNYFSPQQDGLSQEWTGNVFVNPPYTKRQAERWVKKAYDSVKSTANIVVMLIPSRTDVKFWHKYIFNQSNVEVRFIKGRIQFDGVSKNKAPFPSAVIIFRRNV